jgi:hypothetical protein
MYGYQVNVATYLVCNWVPECDGVDDTGDDEHSEAHEEGSNDRVQGAEEREHERQQPHEATQLQPNNISLEEACLVNSPILLPNEVERRDVR